MTRLPGKAEQIAILEAHNDQLIHKHLGNPPKVEEDYRTVLREALRMEYPRRKRWDEAGPEDYDPEIVTNDLLAHLDYAHGREEERSWWWGRREWLKRCHRSRANRVMTELKRQEGGANGEGAALFLIGAMAVFHNLTDQESQAIARAALARRRPRVRRAMERFRKDPRRRVTERRP